MYVRLCVGVYMYAGIPHTFLLMCVHVCFFSSLGCNLFKLLILILFCMFIS